MREAIHNFCDAFPFHSNTLLARKSSFLELKLAEEKIKVWVWPMVDITINHCNHLRCNECITWRAVSTPSPFSPLTTGKRPVSGLTVFAILERFGIIQFRLCTLDFGQDDDKWRQGECSGSGTGPPTHAPSQSGGSLSHIYHHQHCYYLL